MLTSAKIDLKKYFIYSASLLIITFAITQSQAEFLSVLLVFFAACLNQWMLVTAVRDASRSAATGVPTSKFKMLILILGKVAVVTAALIFSVHIMGNRVIIPVLIYVLQIAVLYLSFKKSGAD